MMPFVGRWQLIELIIPATVVGANQQTYFGNQPQLQSISGDKKIYLKGITAYSQDTIASSPLTTGNPAPTAVDILNAVLVISSQGEYAFNMIPLAELCRPFNTGLTPSNHDMFMLKDPWKVDWTKSYIQTIAAPAIVPFSYLFGIVYDYTPDALVY